MDSFFNKMNKLNEQVKSDMTGKMSQLRRRISSGGDMMDEAGAPQQQPSPQQPPQQPSPYNSAAGTRPVATTSNNIVGGTTGQNNTSYAPYSSSTRPTAGGTVTQQQYTNTANATNQLGPGAMANSGGYGPSALTGGSDYSSSTQQRQSTAYGQQQKALTSAPTSPSKSSGSTFAPAASFARSFFTAARQGSVQGGGGLTSAITGAISKGIDAASNAIEQAAVAAQQSSVGQQLAGAGVGNQQFYSQSNVKILLVIDDMSTDWSKYFRKTSGRSALPGGEQIRVEQADFSQLRITVFQDKRGALVDILETTNSSSSGNAPVARTVRPDFVLVRQMARDGERHDYRHILQALLIAGVPSVVNSLDACIEQQERSLTLARLRRLAMPHPMSSKQVVPNALPLIPHIFMPSLDQLRSGGTGAMAAASSFQYPFVVKFDHARRGAAKVLVRSQHELSELGSLAYSIARSNGTAAPYVSVEPYIGDAKYDMLLQRIGPNVERAFIRKAVAAPTTIAAGSESSGRRGSQTAGGGYSTTTAAAQNALTNNMVDHHWKANQGGSLLEAVDVEETHRAWLTAVANMYSPALDVVTIKCLVLANGSAVILGIQDSSMILLGETQEDDRRTFCEIAYEKMAQFVLRRRESSALGPTSGPAGSGGGPAVSAMPTAKLQPQQRQQSLAGRSDVAAPHPAVAASQTSVPNRAYGGGQASNTTTADVVSGQQSAVRKTSGGGQASLTSFRRPSQDQGLMGVAANPASAPQTAGGAPWQQQSSYTADTSGSAAASSRSSGTSDYSSGGMGTYGSNTQRTNYVTAGGAQAQDSGMALGGYGGGGGGSSYSSGMGSLSTSSTGTTINSGVQRSSNTTSGQQSLPQFSSTGAAGTLPSSAMYAQQYSSGGGSHSSGSTGSASSSRSSGTVSDAGGYNSTTTVQYGSGGYGASQPPDNNDLTPRSSFGSSASSAVATNNNSDMGLRDDPYGNNTMAQQQQYGGMQQQYGGGASFGGVRGGAMQPSAGGVGGAGPNGEPDTMQNLKKTFQGIFGDIS